jgi:hypothetical protein
MQKKNPTKIKHNENTKRVSRYYFFFISYWGIAFVFVLCLIAVVNAELTECDDGGKGPNELGVDCGGICPYCDHTYEYLGNYPNNRETGYSETLQGIAHDADNWYFTQTTSIWKIPLKEALNSFTGTDPSRGVIRFPMPEALSSCTDRLGKAYSNPTIGRYNHFGDLYYDSENDLLFIPTEGEGCWYQVWNPVLEAYIPNQYPAPSPLIAVFRASDFTFLAYDYLNSQKNAGWCAINPLDKKLYTSNSDISDSVDPPDKTPLIAYDINWQALRNGENGQKHFLGNGHYIILNSESGSPRKVDGYMQGGEFSDDGLLYLVHGKDSGGPGDGGIKVFDTTTWNLVAKSTNEGGTGGFYYQFQHGGRYEEPEGLTYWDLTQDQRASTVSPLLNSQLHVIMLDNDYTSVIGDTSEDDLYLKHYRFAAVTAIGLTKNASERIIHSGDSVTYTYNLTNKATRSVSNVAIMDDTGIMLWYVSGDTNSIFLDPGETWTYTATTTLTTEEYFITNYATATAIDSFSGAPVTATAQETVVVIHPAIKVEKVASSYTDTDVVYTYTVTNTGDSPLKDIQLTDDKICPLYFACPAFQGGDMNDDGILYPGILYPKPPYNTPHTETWTYTAKVPRNKDVPSFATVRGIDPVGKEIVAFSVIKPVKIENTPIAVDDHYFAQEATLLTVNSPGILSNDIDLDPDALLRREIVDYPDFGVLSFPPGVSFAYLPEHAFTGTDTFTYRIYGGNAWSNTATVTIDVLGATHAPVAYDDEFSTSGTLTINPPGVLENDFVQIGKTLTARFIVLPYPGGLTFNSDGSFIYRPRIGWSGTDSFTYVANDGSQDSNTATVTIHVNPVGNILVTSTPPNAMVYLDTVSTGQLTPITLENIESGSHTVYVTLNDYPTPSTKTVDVIAGQTVLVEFVLEKEIPIIPEFPSIILPATIIIGFLGAVLLIQRTRES